MDFIIKKKISILIEYTERGDIKKIENKKKIKIKINILKKKK